MKIAKNVKIELNNLINLKKETEKEISLNHNEVFYKIDDFSFSLNKSLIEKIDF